MIKNRRHWVFVALLLLIAPALIVVAKSKEEKDDMDVYRNLSIFNTLYKELAISYVDTFNLDKAMETAISSMLNELDPYTEYIPAKDREDFYTISTGEYGGIGSYIMVCSWRRSPYF